MPSKKYAERTHQVTFASLDENNDWVGAAARIKIPLTKYILEMARRGRDAEALRPVDQSKELNKLREDNARLATSERELRGLYERSEAELFKLRHASFLRAPDGLQEPSEKLVTVLKASTKSISNQELLRALGIDPRDIQAMRALLGQLQVLKDFGLLQETPMGWRWVR